VRHVGHEGGAQRSLNLSILDGWWAEYFDDHNGWAIPSADSAGDAAERDALEAAALYDLLEHRIAPRSTTRRRTASARVGAPHPHTLATLAPSSAPTAWCGSTSRALPPGRRAGGRVEADADRGAASSRRSGPRARVRGRRCRSSTSSPAASSRRRSATSCALRAYVELDGLAPDDVSVEVVYGRSRTDESIERVRRTPLQPDPGRRR
jgi:starch phosphorylase